MSGRHLARPYCPRPQLCGTRLGREESLGGGFATPQPFSPVTAFPEKLICACMAFCSTPCKRMIRLPLPYRATVLICAAITVLMNHLSVCTTIYVC